MKFLVLFFSLMVFHTYAATQLKSADEISLDQLTLSNEPEIRVDENGNFELRLVDDDGTTYVEEGVVLTNEETGAEIVIPKKGTYSYPNEDGRVLRFSYDVEKSSDADGR